MKIWMIALLFVVACGSETKMKNFIEGTYVHQADGTLSKASNTLVITAVDDAEHYSVRYTSIYQRKKDGELQPAQTIEKTMTAIFDADKLQLEEPTTGKVIVFLPDAGTLTYGAAEYRKIK